MRIDNDASREQVKSALMELNQSPGWKVLCQAIKEEIDGIENAIFQNVGEEGERVYSSSDLQKVRRNTLLWLIEHPKNLIESYTGEKENSGDSEDPYGKSSVMKDSNSFDGEA